MCVWAICRDVKLLRPRLAVFLLISAGGSGPLMSPLPTKLLMSWEDIGTDHPDVPAISSNLFLLQWDVANPRTTLPICFSNKFSPNKTFSFPLSFPAPVRFSQSVIQEHVTGFVR